MEVSIKNSALWAAFGDALGFMSELTDAKGLKRRINSYHINGTTSWRRFLGGMYGAEVSLPAGCYSDDTQLRLSTSRAIRGDGEFDVETFAKVELPVWLSYALGAGRGTKIAANSLKQQNVNWFSNFYDQEGSNYFQSGGNGAAMRIQPHVWASGDLYRTEGYLKDVIRNSICTHGHPRAILGSVFHAMCLAHAIKERTIPGPDYWRYIIDYFFKVFDVIASDTELKAFWLPVWEERSKRSFSSGIQETVNESLMYLEIAERHLMGKQIFSYPDFVEEVGGLKESERGCGIKTAFIAATLSWAMKGKSPEAALVLAANLLNSDTDSIATMVGAIMGAVSDSQPDGKLEDKQYITAEAARLFHISTKLRTETFVYPDLHQWVPPKTNLDALGTIDTVFALAGLGYAIPSGESFKGRNDNSIWQWFQLDFGQTVLVKRREILKALPKGSYPRKPLPPRPEVRETNRETQTDLFSKNWNNTVDRTKEVNLVKNTSIGSIDELTGEAIRLNFAPDIIGNHILRLSSERFGIEKAIAYTSIIVKAKISRERAGRKP